MMALLSSSSRREIEQVVLDIEKVETATEAEFQNEFVAAMGFPSSSHPYPALASVVTLPTTRAPTPERGRRRPRKETQ
jgi:uncharacterized 2Fe-2S/4Fe-4S cluster protein (DUF4445 family)